jgi:hypothetical protein
MLAEGLNLSLGYHQVDSRGGIKQDGWHGLLSFAF